MAFSLEYTKNILLNLGVCPNRKLGQNFLIEPQIVQRSVEWAQIIPHEVVVEIGPGCGTLTEDLTKAQADVFAVEKDRAFAQHISEKFPVDVLCGDALEFPVGRFDLNVPYKVVANLPYAVASVWLDRVLELSRLPDKMVLLVQKEAADRWFASAGSKLFCALGISLQAAYRMDEKCCVAKRCFYPQPNVDSSLLLLIKRTDCFILPKSFKHFVRKLFIHRRQQIGRVCRESGIEYSDLFLEFLEQHHLSEKVRAEAIPLDLWVEFGKRIKE